MSRPTLALKEELVNQVVSGFMNAQTQSVVDVDTLRVQVMRTDAKLELAALRICTHQPVDASATHESRTIFAPIFKHSPGTGAAEDFGRAVERDERRIAPYRRRQQFDETFEYGVSELILGDRQTMSSSSLLPVVREHGRRWQTSCPRSFHEYLPNRVPGIRRLLTGTVIDTTSPESQRR